MISLVFRRATQTAGWHAACKTIMSGCSGIFQDRDNDGTDQGSIKEDVKDGQTEETSLGIANRICSKMHVGFKKNRRVKNDSKVFGLSK